MNFKTSNPEVFSKTWLEDFNNTGFAIIPSVLNNGEISNLICVLQEADTSGYSIRKRGMETYAMRNLFESVPAVRNLAVSLKELVEPFLGADAIPVRGLLFDKTPEANWKVAWHQDLTIAVQERKEAPGFGPWSVKAGVQHVQPPVSIFERMLTIRLHLDDCDDDNGPLQVLPGSHLVGKLSAEEIRDWRSRIAPVHCVVRRGDALLMRPLLLHASSTASNPAHRRVIHLEFASAQLPAGLQWLA